MSVEEPLQFGDQLRRLRESAGMTQEELAERAGLSVKAIGALERGRRRRPYPHTIQAIADALDLSSEEREELAGSVRSRRKREDDAPPALLPDAPTQLIGRDRDLEEVIALLQSGGTRIVTLTGAGGVGKTRLALEIASRMAERPNARAAFVSLAALNNPSLVLETVAHSIGVSELGDAPVRALLVRHLQGKEWLILLDSVEHVLDAAPQIAQLLADCPDLTILATSRAPLKIRAEREYPVRPLTLPDLSHVPTVDEVSQVSSVQLFMERAVSAVPHFELTQANCAAVAAICRRLDGLPLALELAAPRVRSLSPTELLARLDQALRLLVGGSRDLPQRQQTMSAAIEWSYQLLSTPQQSLFRRLSIFEGGWTLDAAESVTAWGEIVLDEVIDILSDLVEQSLVAVEPSEEGSSRYRMLEPIRQFSHRMALETGEQDTLARYHLNWCLQLAERSASEMRGPNQHQWLDLLDTEHDNLRAALSWSQQREDAGAEELRLATALWRFWEIRGYLTEGRRWLEHALSVTDDVPADLRARGLNAAGNLARDQGDLVQAEKMHEASLRMRREQGDEYGIAVSLTNLANLMLDQGRYAPAEAHYTEALQHFQDQGQRWDIANVQNNLGIVLGYRGEYERATSLLEQALALREELAETASRARTLDALGVVMQRQGELTRARRLHEESLALRLELGEKRGIAIALNNLGIVARSEGNFTEATQLIEESLQLRNTVGDMFGVATSLGALADVARDMGDHDRALRLYRDAISTQRQLGINDGLPDLILGVAALSLAPADPVRSARLLGASEALRETMNQPIPPVNRDGHARIVAGIQRALTPDEYASATERGRRMSLDEAIDEALTSPEVVS